MGNKARPATRGASGRSRRPSSKARSGKSQKPSKASLEREAKKARKKAWKELSLRMRSEHGACEICGSPERLQVHHILPKKQHPGLLLEERNLITLCARHHFILHRGRELEFMAWLERHRPDQFAWIMERAAEYGFPA